MLDDSNPDYNSYLLHLKNDNWIQNYFLIDIDMASQKHFPQPFYITSHIKNKHVFFF